MRMKTQQVDRNSTHQSRHQSKASRSHLQPFRIKKNSIEPVSYEERRKIQEQKDMQKLAKMDQKLDITSMDKRIKRIHAKAKFLSNADIERELAVNSINTGFLDQTQADSMSQMHQDM